MSEDRKQKGFYKQDIEVLKFDIDKDIDLIRFDHYIKQKENFQRIKQELPMGQFYLTIRNVSLDLNITFNKAQRIIKKFEDLSIIKCVFKSKNNKKELSIYEYISMSSTQEYSNNQTLEVSHSTDNVENINNIKSSTHRSTHRSTDSSTQECSNNATLDISSSTHHSTDSSTHRSTSKKDNKKDNKKDIYIEQKVAQKKDLNKHLEELWKEYPKKRGKIKAFKKLPKIINEYGFEQILRAVTRYSEEVKDKEYQFIMQGDTFFNNGYGDYLDNNYDVLVKEQKQKAKESGKGQNNNQSDFDFSFLKKNKECE